MTLGMPTASRSVTPRGYWTTLSVSFLITIQMSQLTRCMTEDYPNPHLVLDHSTIETTSSEVLPYAVPKLQSAGYQLVTVGECLGTDESPYEWVDCPGERDSSWQC